MRFAYTDLTEHDGILFATDEERPDGDVHLLDLRVRDVLAVRRMGDDHHLLLSNGATLTLSPKGDDAYATGMDTMLRLLHDDERRRAQGEQ